MDIWIYYKNENTKKEALSNRAGCNGTGIVGCLAPWPVTGEREGLCE
jgi:hypothetical protein